MKIVRVPAHKGRFFEVLQTTDRSQTAVMTIAGGGDGGPEEIHAADQIIYIIEGEAVIRLGPRAHRVAAGSLVTIPACTRHHVSNPGETPLFFLSVYAPPEY